MGYDMTVGKPLRVILRFMIPLLIGNIFQTLYNMVDTMIVGRFVGANALAAVGSTGTIMFMVMGTTMGLTQGVTILTSQRFGAGDADGVKRSVANGSLLVVCTAALMTVLSLSVIRGLLRLINTPAEIYDDAYAYISVICTFIICNVAYNFLSSLLRAIGNSRVPLYFLIFSAFLNIFLDLIFIVNFGRGTRGAAEATVLSQAIAALLCGVYIFRKGKILLPSRDMLHFDREISGQQLKMAIPMALQFAITASGTVIMQSALNLFGATAVAAVSSANKYHNLVMQGMFALGATMSAYVGQNFGKKELGRIRTGVRTAVTIAVVYGIVAGILVMLFHRQALSLFFASDMDMDSLLVYATPYLSMISMCFVPLGMIFIFRNSMQGCGYSFLPMMVGVMELVFRIAAAAASMALGSFLLAAACDPLAWIGAGVFSVLAYRSVIRRVEASPV
ncbi:MAG: MATE family efflux transporter [Lachnospiraceae bacterium]|nr:MATE family efflux transporter [Lachnospiraceae bacterium]